MKLIFGNSINSKEHAMLFLTQQGFPEAYAETVSGSAYGMKGADIANDITHAKNIALGLEGRTTLQGKLTEIHTLALRHMIEQGIATSGVDYAHKAQALGNMQNIQAALVEIKTASTQESNDQDDKVHIRSMKTFMNDSLLRAANTGEEQLADIMKELLKMQVVDDISMQLSSANEVTEKARSLAANPNVRHCTIGFADTVDTTQKISFFTAFAVGIRKGFEDAYKNNDDERISDRSSRTEALNNFSFSASYDNKNMSALEIIRLDNAMRFRSESDRPNALGADISGKLDKFNENVSATSTTAERYAAAQAAGLLSDNSLDRLGNWPEFRLRSRDDLWQGYQNAQNDTDKQNFINSLVGSERESLTRKMEIDGNDDQKSAFATHKQKAKEPEGKDLLSRYRDDPEIFAYLNGNEQDALKKEVESLPTDGENDANNQKNQATKESLNKDVEIHNKIDKAMEGKTTLATDPKYARDPYIQAGRAALDPDLSGQTAEVAFRNLGYDKTNDEAFFNQFESSFNEKQEQIQERSKAADNTPAPAPQPADNAAATTAPAAKPAESPAATTAPAAQASTTTANTATSAANAAKPADNAATSTSTAKPAASANKDGLVGAQKDTATDHSSKGLSKTASSSGGGAASAQTPAAKTPAPTPKPAPTLTPPAPGGGGGP